MKVGVGPYFLWNSLNMLPHSPRPGRKLLVLGALDNGQLDGHMVLSISKLDEDPPDYLIFT